MLTSLQSISVIDNQWIVIKIQNYIILLTEWISVTSFVCLVSNLFIIYQNKNKHIENCTCNELSYHYQTLHFICNQIRKPRAIMMHEIIQSYRMLTNHRIVAIREKIWWIIILNSFKTEIVKFLSWSQVSVFNLIDSSISTSYLSFWTMKWIKRNM